MLGRHGELFFVQGNATFQDSETVAGSRADAPTNDVRSATGASNYLLNLMLGFDSDDGEYRIVDLQCIRSTALQGRATGWGGRV
jgi:hypothetical protein